MLVTSPLSSGVITATDAGGFDVSGPNWKIPNPDLRPRHSCWHGNTMAASPG